MTPESLQTTLDKINDHSRFVAGFPSRFRNDDDPKVQRTQKDCHSILAALPLTVEMPSISGGTKANPNVYIRLYWLVTAGKLLAPHIDVLGTGRCNLEWSDADGKVHKNDALPVADINKTAFFTDLVKLSGPKL